MLVPNFGNQNHTNRVIDLVLYYLTRMSIGRKVYMNQSPHEVSQFLFSYWSSNESEESVGDGD